MVRSEPRKSKLEKRCGELEKSWGGGRDNAGGKNCNWMRVYVEALYAAIKAVYTDTRAQRHQGTQTVTRGRRAVSGRIARRTGTPPHPRM